MTQKKGVTPDSTRSYLTKHKAEFEKQLEERIAKGKSLLSIEVRRANKKFFLGYQNLGVLTPEMKEYNKEEFEIFISSYNKWNDYNSELMRQSFENPYNEYTESYSASGRSIFLSDDDVVEYKTLIKRNIYNLEGLIEKLDLIEESVPHTKGPSSSPQASEPNNKVFIVHGHDDETTEKVARLLEKLGLEAIILREQASKGKTIIEKIESYSDVGFGIVLYASCDLGASKNDKDNMSPRARQNVIFEHGYLIGRIGRDKVCALTEVGVERPGDIDGVVYVTKDSGNGWKYEIARELQAAGCKIDMNKI